MDPHEVLGVTPDATEDELRAAYRDLVRRHHPDRHATESDAYRATQARRMAEVTGAWTLLHDPDALARYRANRAREGRPPSTTSAPSRPRDGEFDYRRAAASEFDDDPLTGRWGRTPTSPAERAAAQKERAAPTARSSRSRSRSGSGRTGPSRWTRILNAVAWAVLVGLVAAVWLLGTDSGRDVLDDVLGAAPTSVVATDPSGPDGPMVESGREGRTTR